MSREETNRIVQYGARAGSLLAKIAKHAPVPGAAAPDDIIEHFKQRNAQRRSKRLETFVQQLADRQADIQRELTEEEIDLFEEILAAAITAEDEAKLPYYVNCVELYLVEQWAPALVRLVMGALKGLCRIELDALRRFAAGEGGLETGDPLLPRQQLLLRLGALGILPATGTQVRTNLTPVGKKVYEVISRN